MVRNELKRYFKSKWTLLLVFVIIIPIACGFAGTYSQKMMWLEQSRSPGVPADLAEASLVMANAFNWLSYLTNLFSYDEWTSAFLLVLALGFGVVSGTALNQYRSDGYGNFICVREPKRKYVRSLLAAQALYIAIFMLALLAVLTAVSALLFPAKDNEFWITCLGRADTNIPKLYAVVLIQYLLLIIYEVLIMTFASLTDLFVKNRFVILAVPAAMYFIPQIVVTVIFGFSRKLATALSFAVTDNYIFAMRTIATTESTALWYKIYYFTGFPLSMLLLIIIVAKLYTTKMEKAYL